MAACTKMWAGLHAFVFLMWPSRVRCLHGSPRAAFVKLSRPVWSGILEVSCIGALSHLLASRILYGGFLDWSSFIFCVDWSSSGLCLDCVTGNCICMDSGIAWIYLWRGYLCTVGFSHNSEIDSMLAPRRLSPADLFSITHQKPDLRFRTFCHFGGLLPIVVLSTPNRQKIIFRFIVSFRISFDLASSASRTDFLLT